MLPPTKKPEQIHCEGLAYAERKDYPVMLAMVQSGARGSFPLEATNTCLENDIKSMYIPMYFENLRHRCLKLHKI